MIFRRAFVSCARIAFATATFSAALGASAQAMTTPTAAQLAAYNKVVNASYAATKLAPCLILNKATRQMESEIDSGEAGNFNKSVFETVAISASMCLGLLEAAHDYAHASSSAEYVPIWLRSTACTTLRDVGDSIKPCEGVPTS